MPSRRGVLAFVAVALGSGSAWAVDPAVPLRRLAVQRWGENDGLPQPRVRAIAQDAEGYLWLGTDGGVVRFDGARFDVFTPENTNKGLRTRAIRTLLVDAKNRLWIGTHGEGALSVHESRSFRSLRDTADVRGSAIISMMRARDGSLWFGSWSGAMHLEGDAWSSVGSEIGLPKAAVFGMAEAADGTLWFGTWRGLYRVRAGRAEPVRLAGVRDEPPIRALALTPRGTLWVGTVDEGVLEVALDERGDVRSVARHGEPEGLPHHAVEALLLDRQGVLWIGTRGGLARLASGRIETAALGPSYLRSPVESLFEDGDGRLWVGSATDGLLALSSGPIVALTEADGLPRQAATASAMEPDGTIWLGTRGDGVVRVRGGEVARFSTTDGLCTMSIAALLVERPGVVWIGGTGGGRANLCRFRDGRFVPFGEQEGIARSDAVRALMLDSGGGLAVGGAGLYRFVDGRFAREPLPNEVPARPWNVFALASTPDGAWLVATGEGLFRGRPGSWVKLTGAFVASAVERPDGDLWLGTIQGLVRRRPGGPWLWGRNFGVPEQPVHGVVDDQRGYLWIASPGGLARVAANDAVTSVRRFDLADGLPTTQLTEAESPAAAIRAPDGRLFFTTAKGLAIVDPARVRPSLPAPAALIERVRVRHREQRLVSRYELAPGEGDLEIHYTAPAPGRAHRLTFRYRLEPFDADWVDAGARRVAIYTALPHGRYRFEVRAVNEEGVAGPASAAVALEIPPLWHERLGVRLAAVLAIAAAAFLLHRSKLARAEARHKVIAAERTRIAREIHDSLTQELTGISLHLEAAHRRLAAAPEKARANLDQARALVRVGLAEARAVVWDLKPEALRRMGLAAALAELVRQMSGDVPVRLQIDGDGGPMPAEVETALLRVAQEAVANALRHGKPSQVSVTLAFGLEAFELIVRDDGLGFDPAQSPDDRGLGGMRRRMEALGGSVTWTSAPGHGTELRARIPRRSRGDAAA